MITVNLNQLPQSITPNPALFERTLSRKIVGSALLVFSYFTSVVAWDCTKKFMASKIDSDGQIAFGFSLLTITLILLACGLIRMKPSLKDPNYLLQLRIKLGTDLLQNNFSYKAIMSNETHKALFSKEELKSCLAKDITKYSVEEFLKQHGEDNIKELEPLDLYVLKEKFYKESKSIPPSEIKKKQGYILLSMDDYPKMQTLITRKIDEGKKRITEMGTQKISLEQLLSDPVGINLNLQELNTVVDKLYRGHLQKQFEKDFPLLETGKLDLSTFLKNVPASSAIKFIGQDSHKVDVIKKLVFAFVLKAKTSFVLMQKDEKIKEMLILLNDEAIKELKLKIFRAHITEMQSDPTKDYAWFLTMVPEAEISGYLAQDKESIYVTILIHKFVEFILSKDDKIKSFHEHEKLFNAEQIKLIREEFSRSIKKHCKDNQTWNPIEKFTKEHHPLLGLLTQSQLQSLKEEFIKEILLNFDRLDYITFRGQLGWDLLVKKAEEDLHFKEKLGKSFDDSSVRNPLLVSNTKYQQDRELLKNYSNRLNSPSKNRPKSPAHNRVRSPSRVISPNRPRSTTNT